MEQEDFLREFAHEFIKERKRCLQSGNLEKFVTMYEFLFDEILAKSDIIKRDFSPDEMPFLREEFVNQAREYGLKHMPDA